MITNFGSWYEASYFVQNRNWRFRDLKKLGSDANIWTEYPTVSFCMLHFHIISWGLLGPRFASEFRARASNFASKNIGDKYPKFSPLDFRCDPKIEILSQLLRLVVTELPKFFLLTGEPNWLDLGPNFASKLDVRYDIGLNLV